MISGNGYPAFSCCHTDNCLLCREPNYDDNEAKQRGASFESGNEASSCDEETARYVPVHYTSNFHAILLGFKEPPTSQFLQLRRVTNVIPRAPLQQKKSMVKALLRYLIRLTYLTYILKAFTVQGMRQEYCMYH